MFIVILDGKHQNLPHRGVYVLSRQRRSATNPDGLCNDLEQIGFPLDILVRAQIEFAVFPRRSDAEYFLFARPPFYSPVQEHNLAPIGSTTAPLSTSSSPMDIVPGTPSTSARSVPTQSGGSSSTATPATPSTFAQNCQCNSPCQCEILDIVASIAVHHQFETDNIWFELIKCSNIF